MSIELGKPTEYGFRLPLIRYDLSKESISKLEQRDLMLDYGCGNGSNTVLFKDDFVKVVGFDVEKERIDEFQYFFSVNSIENVVCDQYNGGSIPLADESVDFVSSFEVIEHTKDVKKALADIYRVLK